MEKRELLWNEILEHTSDCDYSKCQHFEEHRKYSTRAKFLKIVQLICLIGSVISYMLYFSDTGINKNVFKYVTIAVSVVATVIEILGLALNYAELANKHWLAAQAYQRLYRECQFFCTHNIQFKEFNILIEKAKDIASEINELNLISPSLSQQSYQKVLKSLKDKKYPVHSVLKNEKTEKISDIIDSIKYNFREYQIEIYLYGSYLTQLSARDIDIAVFIHNEIGNQFERDKLDTLANNVEVFYRNNITLDITIITDEDLKLRRFSPLVKNIIDGELFYKSPMVKKCVNDFEIGMTDYDSMIKYFYAKVKEAKDYNETINSLYYFLYHVISKQLDEQSIRWISDVSLRDAYNKFAELNVEYKNISSKFNQIYKLYQKVNVDYGSQQIQNLEKIKEFELIDSIYANVINE